jgi:hypothetical protein
MNKKNFKAVECSEKPIGKVLKVNPMQCKDVQTSAIGNRRTPRANGTLYNSEPQSDKRLHYNG